MKRRGSRPKSCSHGASFSLIRATFVFLPGMGAEAGRGRRCPWLLVLRQEEVVKKASYLTQNARNLVMDSTNLTAVRWYRGSPGEQSFS